MTLGECLARELADTREWTLKLLADIDGDAWGFQPAPGLAHPLWLCGHLAASQHTLIHVRCLGSGVLDESFIAHFPIGRPVLSLDEHAYPPASEVCRVMSEVHVRTIDAVSRMGDSLLAEPAFGAGGAPHPHYKDKLGAVAHCSRHEAFHAGQLAMLRRLTGKPFLR